MEIEKNGENNTIPNASTPPTNYSTNSFESKPPKSPEASVNISSNVTPVSRNAAIANKNRVASQTRTFVQPTNTTITNISQYGPSISLSSTTLSETDSTISLSLPTQCTWFDINAVNEIEKNALPEFFDSSSPSKTPEVYKEYRDFMVNTYQQNPAQYLTQTACRRNLAGDVCAILRVHSFLEYWGLINFNITPELSTPPLIKPLSSPVTTPLDKNAPPLQQLINFDSTKKNEKAETATTSTSIISTRKNVFPVPLPEFYCNSCGSECSNTRYQFNQGANTSGSNVSAFINGEKKNGKVQLVLCPSCFTQGKFPEHCTSTDFQRVDAAVDPPVYPFSSDWTDQETVALLEALEHYADDWDAVADYVGTKSKEQCVLHFIRMPIEDPFLEDQLNKVHQHQQQLKEEEEEEEAAAVLNKDPLAFAGAANPIMAMVAFIASVISPTVAAAAAQAALDTFLRQRKEDHLRKSEAKKTDGTSDPSSTDAATENNNNNNNGVDATDKMDVEAIRQAGPASSNFNLKEGLSEENIKEAAGTAVAAASLKAKLIAQKEEKEIYGLVAKVIDLQLKKLELKSKYFEDIEQMLDKERAQIERARQQLYAEQLAFSATKIGAAMQKMAPNVLTPPAKPATPLQTTSPIQSPPLPSGENTNATASSPLLSTTETKPMELSTDSNNVSST